MLQATPFGAAVQIGPDELAVSLPEGTERDAIAEINRLLVEGGISVYRLQHIQASLEQWFLEVTSRSGGSGMTTISDIGALRLPRRSRRRRGAITAARGSRPGPWSPRASWSCAGGGG